MESIKKRPSAVRGPVSKETTQEDEYRSDSEQDEDPDEVQVLTQKPRKSIVKKDVPPKPKRMKAVVYDEISDDSTTLQFMKISERAQTPVRATEFAAGLDLFSAYDYIIHARERILCKTDLSISIPWGCYARIAPRSGLSLNHGIDIGAGVIDPDYRGNVGVVLINFSDKIFYVKTGDRIAQLICERILYPRLIECKYLSSTVRDAQTEEKKKETPNVDVDFEAMYEQEFEEKQNKEKEEISNNLIASEIFWLSKRGQTEAFRILFKDFLPFLQIGSFEYDRITTTFRPCRSSPWTNPNSQFKSIAEIPLGDSRIFDLFKGKFEMDFTRALQQAEDKKKEYENKLITQQQRYQQSRYTNKKYSSYN